MEPTITLAELIDGNVEIAVTDAVAIAQQLMCRQDIYARAGAPYGPPTLESIAVTADGGVECLHTAATPSVMEVALVLQTLIGRSSERLPGGLRYAIGRALLEVEAPPFDSASDFSAALSRFESGDRRQRIAGVYSRARAAAVDNGQMPEESHRPQVERRAHQPSAAELRRQLREADLRLYEAQRAAGADHHIVRRRRARKAPIAACMMAGVALVAAGEFAYVERHPETTTRPADPQLPTVVAPAPVRTTESREPAFEGPTLEGPVVPQASTAALTSPGQPSNLRRKTSAAPRTSASTTGARTVRTRAVKPARPDAKAAATPRPKERDRSDHALLRIRFEWNNPFH
jgi:hypothetical protein